VTEDTVVAALYGLCVGDALGVPVEFSERQLLDENPVQEMIGFAVHDQPPGTWSDDSSLSFCLAESLCDGYDLSDQARLFSLWYHEGYWSAYGTAFDVGNTTRTAILRLDQGLEPSRSGGTHEYDNGNGSLMRILPGVLYCHGMSFPDRARAICEMSSVTHAHPRSVLACLIYTEFCIACLDGYSPREAYGILVKNADIFRTLRRPRRLKDELKTYARILDGSLLTVGREDISSSGYVVDTLEASLWCLLQGESYVDTVLTAVNLGDDTDTTATAAGGPAGIWYGLDSIPEDWIHALSKHDEIMNLARRFAAALTGAR
jgi:ADP-ribosyl-[dinitrogen reductase] hydrolase